MSYQEQSDLYRGPDRNRYEMCVREQAHLTYAASADTQDQALANDVISGDMKAIDALIAAITVGPNSASLDVDADVLAAVQASWSVTAAAMHPQTA